MDKLPQTNDNNCEIINFLITESNYLDNLIKVFGTVTNNMNTFLMNFHNHFTNHDTHDKILEIEFHLSVFKTLLNEFHENIKSNVSPLVPVDIGLPSPCDVSLIHSEDFNLSNEQKLTEELVDEEKSSVENILDVARYNSFPSQDTFNDLFNKNSVNNFNLINISMGSLLASMLWIFSKQENFVEILLTNENYLRRFIVLCDSVLRQFLILFDNNLPSINSSNFKYVLSISGILTNISALYQGRECIMSYKEGLNYIEHVFGYINKLYTDGGDPLRRIFLMFLCNIANNRKGLAFMHFLGNCILSTIPGLMSGNSRYVIELTLCLLINILTDCPSDVYENLKENIPANILEELKMSGNVKIAQATNKLYNLLTTNINDSFVTQ